MTRGNAWARDAGSQAMVEQMEWLPGSDVALAIVNVRRVLNGSPQERRTLRAWQRSTAIRSGLARRARMILLMADGMTITDIAATVGISRRFVYKWAWRFLEQRVEGLVDKPGRGGRGDPRQARPKTQRPA